MNKAITLTSVLLKECLKQARYYEFCKDADRALAVIKPIWADIEEPPDVSDLSPRDAWEVMLVCGGVISSYGSTYQKKYYQQLAADMLTRARDAAIEIGDRELIAESEKQMATAYWRNGQADNAVAILHTALGKYSDVEQLHNTICLLAQSNLLMLYLKTNQYNDALSLFEKLRPFVDQSDDIWLKTVFYNNAAGIFVSVGKYASAIPLLEKAVKYSTAAKNNTYLGSNLNNLANAYINLPVPNAKAALDYAEQAGKLFLTINQLFPYALALETQAVIHTENGDYQKALLVIGESIKFLQKGENYQHLCDSLWTRTDILIKDGEIDQAIRQFADLMAIANEHLSLLAGDEYIRRFRKKLYLPVGKNLEEKETNFRAFLLDEALAKNAGVVTSTAKYLGVIHQTLSNILKKFPEIVERHQVKLRNRRASPKKEKAKNDTQREFVMRINSSRLAHAGLNKNDIIKVSVLPLEEINLSKPIVFQDTNKKYHCGFLVDAFGMFAFEDGRGNIERTYVASEIIQVGEIKGILDPEINDFISFENQ